MGAALLTLLLLGGANKATKVRNEHNYSRKANNNAKQAEMSEIGAIFAVVGVVMIGVGTFCEAPVIGCLGVLVGVFGGMAK